MVSKPEVLAIVQARAGSKGLPYKNIRYLGNHPLIAYSIASGLAAQTVTRVILSTDGEEIAEVGKAYGAEVPFTRPNNLAEDETPDYPLFVHALEWLRENENYTPDIVVQLRPTTPFRPQGMIDQAVKMLIHDPNADCVRGVTTPKQTPYKMWREGEGDYILPLLETEFAEPYNMPRQHLPATFWQTGHVDAIRTTTITEKKSLTGNRVLPIEIELKYCVDIDTLADFELAQQAIEKKSLDIDFPIPVVDVTPIRNWPDQIDLIVFDFDGVFTDNCVLVDQQGIESVKCNRSDGMGISLMRQMDVPMLVLSTETNPVVESRCKKLQLETHQGIGDKFSVLKSLCESRNYSLDNVIYLGNDVNDLACMQQVGFAVAPADAYPEIVKVADWMLTKSGGQGAVREFCDLFLNRLEMKKK